MVLSNPCTLILNYRPRQMLVNGGFWILVRNPSEGENYLGKLANCNPGTTSPIRIPLLTH